MSIFQVTIPVINYEGDGIFEQELFFEGEKCPSKEQVIEEVEKRHDRVPDLLEHGGWNDCLKTLACVTEWPYIGGNLVLSSTQVFVPELAQFSHSLCIRKTFPLAIRRLVIVKL